MLLQYVIVASVLALAATYVARSVLRSIRSRGCAEGTCGCSGGGGQKAARSERLGRRTPIVPLEISATRREQ